MGWLDLLTIPITAGINYGVTSALNEQNAKLNQKYWDIQNKKLYEQSEQSAENAHQRTIDLYNQLQSPQAMVEQLKSAGLNPALMYNKSGMGGSVSSGAQASVQGGQGAPTLGLQQILDPLTISQIKNIEADTKNKDADTKNKDANTAKTKEETENIRINKSIMETTQKLMNLEFELKDATFWHEYNKIVSEMYYWQGMAQAAVANGTLQQETLDTMIQTTQQNLQNLKMEYALNKKLKEKYGTEIENNKELKEKIIAEKEQIRQITKNLEEELKVISQDYELKLKQTNTEEERTKLTKAQEQAVQRTIQESIDKYDWKTISKEDVKFLLQRRTENQKNNINLLDAIIPF